MSGLRICPEHSAEHGYLTQTDKYGHHVTFVLPSQCVIQLVVTQDKPELRGYTKRPSVTQSRADLTQGCPGQHSDPGSHSANLSEKPINTGPDPYIRTLFLKHTALTMHPLYRPETIETHAFCPDKGAWPVGLQLLMDTRKQCSSHKHTYTARQITPKNERAARRDSTKERHVQTSRVSDQWSTQTHFHHSL